MIEYKLKGYGIQNFRKSLNSFGFENGYQRIRRNNSDIVSEIFLNWIWNLVRFGI